MSDKIQIDGNKIILDYLNEIVLNPERTSGYDNFDEDVQYRDIVQGTSISSSNGTYTISYTGSARYPVGTFAILLKMSDDITKRHLKITVTSQQTDSYCIVYGESYSAVAYSSYKSPIWENFTSQQVNVGSPETILFPDFRCRCVVYFRMGSGTPKSMTIKFEEV